MTRLIHRLIAIPAGIVSSYAVETKSVTITETHTQETVYFVTPDGKAVDTKKLFINGVWPRSPAEMESGIIAPSNADGVQWAEESKKGLIHKYQLVLAKATTAIAAVVKGKLGDIIPPPTVGRGEVILKKVNFDVTMPAEAIVASKTERFAADGKTPSTRLAVGVGEIINFEVGRTHLAQPDVEVNFAMAGLIDPLAPLDVAKLSASKTFSLRVYDVPGTFILKLKFAAAGKVEINGRTIGTKKGVIEIPIAVVAPVQERVTKVSPQPPFTNLTAGKPGAMMLLRYTAQPLSVNYTRTLVLEVGTGAAGDPVALTGHFASVKTTMDAQGLPDYFRHYPHPTWVAYSADNDWDDLAGWGTPIGLSPARQTALDAIPYKEGSFRWEIPVQWKTDFKNTPHPSYTRIQRFRMLNAFGTGQVTKTDSFNHEETSEPRNP